MNRRRTVVLVLLTAFTSCTALVFFDFARETGSTAFVRMVTAPIPASVVLKEYWRALGIGGDGVGVITFQASQDDLLRIARDHDYKLIPHEDEAGWIMLTIELQILAERTRRRDLVGTNCLHYALSTRERQNHLSFDTNDPANAVFYFRAGPPI